MDVSIVEHWVLIGTGVLEWKPGPQDRGMVVLRWCLPVCSLCMGAAAGERLMGGWGLMGAVQLC